MNSVLTSTHTHWRFLYQAAILETDRSVRVRRVLEAEQAIIERGREVFYAPATLEETEALDDALYILRALRTATQWSESEHSQPASGS